MKRLFPVVAFFSCLISGLSFAGSATWNLNPTDGRWNTAENWTPATVPNGPADTATFAASSLTALSLPTDVELDSIVFDSNADAFTITDSAGRILTISGAGVTNNSGVLQNFVNLGDLNKAAMLFFTNNATAGESVVYTNQPPIRGAQSPLIQFEDSSSAGSAEFDNVAANYFSQGGLIEFRDNSTAANGTFRNTGIGDERSPTINFRDNASAGQAVFTNEVDAEGIINFYGNSTADQAMITNNGQGGLTDFFEESTAGNATIINEGEDAYNGASLTLFHDNSTAGNGTFIVKAGLDNDGEYATLQFDGSSKAGTGTFIANGSGFVSTFTYGGLIIIAADSSADHGTFYLNAGQVAGAYGGQVDFENSATAEAATFYLEGAAVEAAFGGRIRFRDSPGAASSTLIASGGVGTEEGAGGGILFEDNSSGNYARVELLGNGFLDLRGHNTRGLTIGSLEGDGLVFLGSITLSIGSNNLSTNFSGLIEEHIAGAMGALTKVGTGSLTLSGANTYTGGTTIAGGILVVNNRTGSATGTGPVQVNAGQLGGRGIIDGAVVVGTGSGPGATLAPSKENGKPNPITVQGALTFNSDATYECGINTKSARADKVVANGVTINGGQFTLRDPRGSVLTPGTVLIVIDNTSPNSINGTFANLADGSTVTVGVNKLQVSYSGGDGNDLTLTVVP
jgi:autotransporter-associated beta strand protein